MPVMTMRWESGKSDGFGYGIIGVSQFELDYEKVAVELGKDNWRQLVCCLQFFAK